MEFTQQLDQILSQIHQTGLYKQEHPIAGPQSNEIRLEDGQVVFNFCANNYLGFANHPAIMQAAHQALDAYGFGMASVRFICGTQSLHRDLETTLAAFLGMEDSILFTSCFDANGGLFEALLGEEDAVISDALNHASIIDGIRLCKAKRFRYANRDMAALEDNLRQTQKLRHRLIVTDGVFSMDGSIAPLAEICSLAKRYNALVAVDDSHATGFMGEKGRGTHEYCNVLDEVDILTGTFGKALGGASGGYVSASRGIVDLLRQRARPYLFSNSLPPMIVAATLKALELLQSGKEHRQQLWQNALYFRQAMQAAGFKLLGERHPIVPVMIGDARLASDMAAKLLEKGIYVVGFSYPVVPKDMARIRVQLSASHTRAQLDMAIQAFIEIGRSQGVI